MKVNFLLVTCGGPTFFIGNTRLVTSVLNLLCLHSKYSIIIVAIAKITAAASTNLSTMRLLVKKFLIGDYISISCLSFSNQKIHSSIYPVKYIPGMFEGLTI